MMRETRLEVFMDSCSEFTIEQCPSWHFYIYLTARKGASVQASEARQMRRRRVVEESKKGPTRQVGSVLLSAMAATLVPGTMPSLEGSEGCAPRQP